MIHSMTNQERLVNMHVIAASRRTKFFNSCLAIHSCFFRGIIENIIISHGSIRTTQHI